MPVLLDVEQSQSTDRLIDERQSSIRYAPCRLVRFNHYTNISCVEMYVRVTIEVGLMKMSALLEHI